jgi:Arc/MetJ-type ribon-helix-helix transcriptional regulator
VKVSISLAEEDVAFLDEYARAKRLSRSAAIQRAVRLLKSTDLEAAYEVAFDEWANNPDAELWESTVGDGLESSTS